ncbi:MAG: TfuA-like protein [Pseudomonadota bacterium]
MNDKASKTHIFLGPTVSAKQAMAILPAICHPPIAQGDVIRMCQWHNVERLVIIDGYFLEKPSVTHKEILWALSHGIEVHGASSMGALRAAELASFGMRGRGKIFEYYRDTPLAGDDEVALLHADEDFRYAAITAPLINLRFTAAALIESGQLRGDQTSLWLNALAALPFQARTNDAIRKSAATYWDTSESEAERLIHEYFVDQKAIDARTVLATLASDPCDGNPTANLACSKHGFVETNAWRNLFLSVAAEPEDLSDEEEQVLATIRDDPHRYVALKVEAQLLAAIGLSARVGDTADADQWLETWIELHDFANAGEAERALKHAGLSSIRLERLVHDEAQFELVDRLTRQTLRRKMVDQLRLSGTYAEIVSSLSVTKCHDTPARQSYDFETFQRLYLWPHDHDRTLELLDFDGGDALRDYVITRINAVGPPPNQKRQ